MRPPVCTETDQSSSEAPGRILWLREPWEAKENHNHDIGSIAMRKPPQKPRTGCGVRSVALAWTALIAIGLVGCGGGARPQIESSPPVVSEYKGWRTSVTPSRVDTNRWRARVRVWPPEVRPDNHPGISLSVTETATDRRAAEQIGAAAARRYIEASQAVHPTQR